MRELIKAKYNCLAMREVINDLIWLKIPKYFTSDWGTDKINMSIPVEIFVNDKTKIIKSLDPPYRHVVCLNAVKIIWYWFIFRMEQYEIRFITAGYTPVV